MKSPMHRAGVSLRTSLRLARLYVAILAILTIGRWAQGLAGIPYERGHHVFSIVIFTAASCIYYPAFARRWRGYGLLDGIYLAVILGMIAQLVILVSTVASYAFGLHTYFNDPIALNSTEPLDFASALSDRLGTLVGNSVLAGVLGAMGWAMAGLLPED